MMIVMRNTTCKYIYLLRKYGDRKISIIKCKIKGYISYKYVNVYGDFDF